MHDAVNKERQKKHFCLSRSAVTGKCRSTKDLHRQWSLVSADLSTTSRRNFPLFALSCCRAYLILTDRGPSSRRGDVGVEKTAAMQVTTFYDGGERICFGAVSIISCHVGILGLLRWTKLMTGSINGRDIAQLMWLGLLPRVHSFSADETEEAKRCPLLGQLKDSIDSLHTGLHRSFLNFRQDCIHSSRV